MIKKVIDFNRLPKQEYMKPTVTVVQLQHSQQILAGSIPTLQGSNNSGDGSKEDDWYDLE